MNSTLTKLNIEGFKLKKNETICNMENISKIALILSGLNLIVLVLLILFVKYTILEYLNCLYERIKALQKGDKIEKLKKYIKEEYENTFGGCASQVQMEANIRREIFSKLLKIIDKL